VAKYFNFVMVKNLFLQFSFVNYLKFVNNLNCFGKYSVSFKEFGSEHKKFEFAAESFNLKFKNLMITNNFLDPFSLSFIITQ
jgi:hypothetical protein